MVMLKNTKAFFQSYHNLNAEQKRAVDSIEGPVMVIAGPGTGKTQILATRIANILVQTDTNPSSILALTFTESGAVAMKRRLISLVGETAYSVNIQTFHSFCSEMIATHPEYFSLTLNAQPLSDLDRYQLLEELLVKNTFTSIKPVNAPFLYLKSVLSNIQNLKREGIVPEKFAKILEQEQLRIETESETWTKVKRDKANKDVLKNQELLELYQQYQEQLTVRERYDFEDMINLTKEALTTHELLLAEYQERLQYFLVDEYQDTNTAQNEVLQLLASYWGENANVFVVGDPNQSIYRFQGASLENTFGFLQLYPQATVISLKQNYRSTQLILDAAKTVIDHHPQPEKLPVSMEQTLVSQSNAKGNLPILFAASSNTLEYVYVAETIEKLIKAGIQPQQIAVIYKNNKESEAFADILSRYGVGFEIEGGSDILTHPLITQLIVFFEVLVDIRHSVEDVNLFTLLNYSWMRLNPLAILKSIRSAQEQKLSFYSFLTDQTVHAKHLESLTAVEVEQFQTLSHKAGQLAYWSGLDPQLTLPLWFEQLIQESGFLAYILEQPNAIELLSIVNSFFSEIKRAAALDHTVHLSEFLETVHTMMSHNLHIAQEDLNITTNAVKLVTAHKSKGQEWEHVFVTGLVDKRWGNSSIRNLLPLPEGILQFSSQTKETQLDDDRRLFYVALTRAKKQLYLSYPKAIVSENKTKELNACVYVSELPPSLLETEEAFEAQLDQSKLMVKLVQPSEKNAKTDELEKVFIDAVLARFKLSSTALNTYLECPYKFKLQVLFRIPRTKPAHMAFGTAIHKALEYLFDQMKTSPETLPTLDQVMAQYRQALQKEVLTPEEFTVRLDQGNKVLTQYYEEYHSQFIAPLFTERGFGVGFSKPTLDDIPLSGKIDKIQLLDPLKKTVKVVDYKTGQSKSRNEIEGKTQNSDGNYKRQLVFYKLLTDLDRSFKMEVEQAEFDFVQPKSTGKFVKHSFLISSDEVNELKQLIRETMVKVRAHEFSKTTDPSHCEKCVFKQHCWPEGNK